MEADPLTGAGSAREARERWCVVGERRETVGSEAAVEIHTAWFPHAVALAVHNRYSASRISVPSFELVTF